MTKQFTGMAILDLIHEQRLSRADPIAKFFPETQPDLFMKLDKPITIQHLLNQTSGLPEITGHAYHWGSPVRISYFLQLLKIFPKRHMPGTKYAYSNLNFLLLGEIVARVSGQSYEAYLQSHYWDPLHMKATGMFFKQGKPRAYGHNKVHGRLIPSDEVYAILAMKNYDWPHAADGGMVSSVTDLIRWIDFLHAERQAYFTEYADDWRADGYFAGLWNIGSSSKPVYWHNGILTPIGYNGDLLFDSNNNKVIVLANADSPMAPLDLARKIYAFLENQDEASLTIPPAHPEGSAALYYFGSRIHLDILMSLLAMLVLYKLRKHPHFVAISYTYFCLVLLFNSFGLPQIKNSAAMTILIGYWLILWRGRQPIAAVRHHPLAGVILILPSCALIVALVILYNR
jgi:CubicO group peptidase (beta-lactamase class C family)